MEPSAVQPTYEVISKTLALIEHACDKEAALMCALKRRYPQDQSLRDRNSLDAHYVDAMRILAKEHPKMPTFVIY